MLGRSIFVLVLAPIAAAVTIGTLLLLGVSPHAVFFAGHLVKSWLKAVGVNAPNAVDVVSTVVCCWAVIVALGLAWERRRQPRAVER